MKRPTLILGSVTAFMAAVEVKQTVCGGKRAVGGELERLPSIRADSLLVGVNCRSFDDEDGLPGFAAKERAWSDNEARREAVALALQQARYEAERIGRQYDAVEPENRLVAAELERRWNDALAKVAALERELEKIPTSSAHLEAGERERLLALAQDFPRVWNDSETDARLKKRIIRTLVEEIVADVDEERALIRLVIHWAGGCHSTLEVKKNRTGHHRYCTEQRVIDLVRELAKVAPDRDIARIVNRLELKTGRGNAFTEARVVSLRHQQGIPPYSPLRQEEEGWLNIRQAAKLLGISPMSVGRLL